MVVSGKELRAMLLFSDGDYEAMLKAAVQLHQHGDLEQAETILVGLMTFDEDDLRPVKLLASTLFLKQRHAEAEDLYERALAKDGDDPYVLVALGEIKLRAFKLDEALPLFERLFAMDPNGTLPPANRGRQLVRDFHRRMSDQPVG